MFGLLSPIYCSLPVRIEDLGVFVGRGIGVCIRCFQSASLEYSVLLQEKRPVADSEVRKRMVSSNNSSGRSRSRLDPGGDVVFWLACGERLVWSEISTVVMMPVTRRAGMWLSMVSCDVDFRKMMFCSSPKWKSVGWTLKSSRVIGTR